MEACDSSPLHPEEPPPEPAVVGLGASAGGLRALRSFFEDVPSDSGVAYVVVVHLSPEHESHLAELLRPACSIPIEQVTETVPLEGGKIYVIPPNANLDAIDTHLRLSALEESRRERAPVDHFFRTLSRTHGSRAVGVVLTGTGSDGALGLKEIKEYGGLTIAQDPGEAEHSGMPQSAIATGLVDLVLPVDRMSRSIQAYLRTEPRMVVLGQDEEDRESEQGRLLQRIFVQIRSRTGRDFSRYKRSTILRRIARRMQILQVEELSEYVDLLRRDPDQVRVLSEELLITVTNFFRDREVFEKLEKEVVPSLFEGKGPDDQVRVWSVGCATGEEAYSLAILLLEEVSRMEAPPKIQVFASDLHEGSLIHAREGFYAGEIEADVSSERLKRFFYKDDGGYRIREEVREAVVFAAHDIMSDPPFSHLDLVVCRNLLIYLQREVQEEVVGIFHYALEPNGFLAIGTSEVIDPSEFFQVVDKRESIYRRRDVSEPGLRLPSFMAPRPPLPGAPEEIRSREARSGDALPGYGRLHVRMLERYAPPSLLVSPDNRVVHLSENAGRYLIHPGGEITASVFKLVREELAVELRATLHTARREGAAQRSRPVGVRFDGEEVPVMMRVRPAPGGEEEGFALVLFEEAPPGLAGRAGETVEEEGVEAVSGAGGEEEPEPPLRAAETETELGLTRQRLQAVIEEHETSQEELRASNEELQSSNEELRSTLEELETSKEELQSMNEELQTVNQENRNKVEELARLSADLQSLLTSTEIATLFLDRDFRIMRYTPRVADLFSVRPADRGRPLADLTHRLGHHDLQEDVEQVLGSLIPVERELEDEEGRWYLTRILPYRSATDRIEGIVITFVDITRRREAEGALRELNATLEERVEERTRQIREKEERVQELASRLARAEEDERRRVRQVLHDDLQQLLFGVQMKIMVLGERIEKGEMQVLASDVAESLELLEEALAQTRRLTLDLDAQGLDGEDLAGGLEKLAAQMRDRHGLEVETRCDEGLKLGSSSRLTLLLGAIRELLFNVAKHAGTERAEVRVESEEGGVRAVVRDHGVGFNPDEVGKEGRGGGIGLRTVLEQVGVVGGEVEIESASGDGAQIEIYVPCSGDA